MSVPEAQLETWSKVGSQTQSKDTCATIRNALDDKSAPYAGNIEIFLQGSYGNDTNVYGKDSDIDIVMLCDRAYFRDLSRLTALERAAYDAAVGGAPSYPFATFKADVIQILKTKFGADVDTSSKKAVKIKANGNRRTADVLMGRVIADQIRTAAWNRLPPVAGIFVERGHLERIDLVANEASDHAVAALFADSLEHPGGSMHADASAAVEA